MPLERAMASDFFHCSRERSSLTGAQIQFFILFCFGMAKVSATCARAEASPKVTSCWKKDRRFMVREKSYALKVLGLWDRRQCVNKSGGHFGLSGTAATTLKCPNP